MLKDSIGLLPRFILRRLLLVLCRPSIFGTSSIDPCPFTIEALRNTSRSDHFPQGTVGVCVVLGWTLLWYVYVLTVTHSVNLLDLVLIHFFAF